MKGNRSYIVFDSAPTVLQCTESLNWTEIPIGNRWELIKTTIGLELEKTTTTIIDDVHPPRPSSSPLFSQLLPVPSIAVNDEVKFFGGTQESDEFHSRRSQIWNDLQSELSFDSTKEDTTYEGNSTLFPRKFYTLAIFQLHSTDFIFLLIDCRTLPPPSNAQQTVLMNDSLSIVNSQVSASTDYPPKLPWHYNEVTTIDKLESHLREYKKSGPYTSLKVNLLAVILSVKPLTQAGNSVKAEWLLGDSSENRVNLIMWNDDAEEIWESAIVGDVIYLKSELFSLLLHLSRDP